ncbi:30S ribosomal protein S7 [Candidatus Roizmanbacteria bacterium]|nr:30S ribosomal protein S7 [Candidatus Roizmanbacteria bacterium]
MPRRHYQKKKIKPDPLYNNFEIAKLINYLMKDGKKTVAERIVYEVMDNIKKDDKDAIKILHQAIGNVAPVHEVKPRRLGGASYLVPIEVRRDRKFFLALNWIVNAATARPNKEYKTFGKKLLAELYDAANNQGQAVSKRQQTEKLAEANKAFSHLRW